jgi:type III restriction enzyme
MSRRLPNLGTFGRWAFLEFDGANLHKTKQEIRKLLRRPLA